MNFYALIIILFALIGFGLGIYQVYMASSQFNKQDCDTKTIDNAAPISFLMNGIFIIVAAIFIVNSEYSNIMG
jgi:hypothetical protein